MALGLFWGPGGLWAPNMIPLKIFTTLSEYCFFCRRGASRLDGLLIFENSFSYTFLIFAPLSGNTAFSGGSLFVLGLLVGPGAQLGPNLNPAWAQLGPTWPNLAPTWPNLAPTWPNLVQLGCNLAQLGPNLAPTWSELGATWRQIGPKIAQLGPTWPQLAPTWSQHGSNKAQLGPTEPNLAPKWFQN